MDTYDRDCRNQLAEIASSIQQQRTGHPPTKVDVAFAGDALVVVLQDALTTAEKQLAKDPQAANQLQAFHRELFLSSSNTMKREVAKITGRTVRESVSELETGSEALVYAPVTGVMIQVYILNSQENSGPNALDEHDDTGAIERAEDEGLRISPSEKN